MQAAGTSSQLPAEQVAYSMNINITLLMLMANEMFLVEDVNGYVTRQL